jgi:integration host factor subunit beta
LNGELAFFLVTEFWESIVNRSDLILALADRYPQLDQKAAETAVKLMLDAIGDAMVRGQRVEIRGFGSFSMHIRPPRIGRNPRSGAQVAIPEKRVLHFKPGKALREQVKPLASGRQSAADSSSASKAP